MLKSLKILILGALLQFSASCAYLGNDKTVDVSISSLPAGADIIVDGRNYGKTPRVVKLEPRNREVLLVKNGYGTARLKLEAWQAVRKKKGEGGRCLADALGTMLILPAFSYWSVYCRDFKQDSYNVTIPYSGAAGTGPQGGYQGQGQRGQGYYGGYYGGGAKAGGY